MIKNSIHKLVRWFADLVGYQVRYKTVLCEDLPDNIERKVLYVVGENNTYWMAAMVCPCGCGDLIQLALDPTGRPRWQIHINKKFQATLKPSVHRMVSCRSHFFIRKGRVIWC